MITTDSPPGFTPEARDSALADDERFFEEAMVTLEHLAQGYHRAQQMAAQARERKSHMKRETRNPEAPDLTNAVSLISEAAKRVGVIWWFVAVGAVIAVLFLVSKYDLPPEAIVLGSIGLLAGVVALAVATTLVTSVRTAEGLRRLSSPGKALMWSFLVLIILSGLFTFTSFFFDSPLPLKSKFFPTVTPASATSPTTVAPRPVPPPVTQPGNTTPSGQATAPTSAQSSLRPTPAITMPAAIAATEPGSSPTRYPRPRHELGRTQEIGCRNNQPLKVAAASGEWIAIPPGDQITEVRVSGSRLHFKCGGDPSEEDLPVGTNLVIFYRPSGAAKTTLSVFHEE